MFLLAQVVNGVAHSFGILAFTTMTLTRVDKTKMATVLAKLSTFSQLISVPAPIIGGYVYKRYGFNILLYNRMLFLISNIIVILYWITPSKDE